MHTIVINNQLDDSNIPQYLEDIGYTYESKVKDFVYVISHKETKFIAKFKEIKSEEDLISFENDYFVCRRLQDHKNVEHVYDYYIFMDSAPKYFCLITAYYEYNYDKRDVLRIMRDLCEGVQELLNNAHHYIHVNPENIIYNIEEDCFACSLFTYDPYYLPPEYMTIDSYEHTGKHYSNFYEFLKVIDNAKKETKYHNGHIFSLGLCMYYLMKGTLPYIYKSEIEMYKGITKDEKLLFTMALADMPKKRFADASAMLKAINMMDEFYYGKGALKRISKEKHRTFYIAEKIAVIKSYFSNFFKVLLIASIILVFVLSGNMFAREEKKNSHFTQSYINNTYLDKITPIKKNNVMFFSNNTIQTNDKKEYTHYIQPLSSYSEITYHLNEQYDYFKAYWALSFEGRKTKNKNNFDIYLDNKLAYSSPTLVFGNQAVPVLLDIKNANTLSIVFKEGQGDAVLCNPYVYNKEKKETIFTKQEYALSRFITELDYMNKKGFIYPHSRETKTFRGNAISHYIEGSKGDSISYFLDRKYKNLSGVWAIKQHKNTLIPQKFELYGDDQLIYTSEEITCRDNDKKFDIDVTKYKKITFTFPQGTGDGIIGNIRLTPSISNQKLIDCYLPQLENNGVWLSEFNDYFVDSNIQITTKKTKSHTGHILNHAITGEENGEIIYYLDGNYDTLVGLWTILKSDRNTKVEQQFSIYSNNTLIYDSTTITGNSCTQNLRIPIEKCYELKIVFNKGNYSGALANVQLIKN